MAFEYSVLKTATEQLERRKRDHEEELYIRRQAIYAKYPELLLIDNGIKRTMSELFAITLGKSKKTVDEIREENLELQHKKIERLKELNLPENALDESPLCLNCDDVGYKGGRMCDCLKTLCTRAQNKALSKVLNLGAQSFESFNRSFYSQNIDTTRGKSPRDNMEFIFDFCKTYSLKFGEFSVKNLYFNGNSGLGKTFLSACIARVVTQNGFSVVYDTATNVFTQFEQRRFSRNSADIESAKDETRRYLQCDLLILDDLGTELTTELTRSALYELINSRLLEGKHTIISSNYSISQVKQLYGMQIASRIEGEYEIFDFFGDDIRVLKKYL